MKQHLHRLHTSLKKTASFLFKKEYVISFLVSVTVLSASALAYTSLTEAPYRAELGFTERSRDPNVVGSVVPASCESYPVTGPTHAIVGHGGHCSGTCPVGYSINNRPYYRECVYHQFTTGEGGVDLYSYYETYATESCPSVHPTTGYNLETNDLILVPLCSKQCANGSWSFPHIGILCPASVQLDFTAP